MDGWIDGAGWMDGRMDGAMAGRMALEKKKKKKKKKDDLIMSQTKGWGYRHNGKEWNGY
jgi:hypothetical protein